MNKAIVVGCGVPGYAVIRGLAHWDIEIIALSHSKDDIAHLSRYVSEVVHITRPDKDEEQFISVLLQNVSRWKGALILETNDNAAVVLSRHKEMLSKYYRIATPDYKVLDIFIEKEKTYALAEECGVPFPKSYALNSWDDLEKIQGLLYPCILKPIRSFEFVARFHTKNFKVENDRELREKFKLCLEAGQPVILQEVVPGADDNLYKMQGYVNSQGKMVGKFFYRKLRQNPPQFGVLRVGVSTERYPEVERLTEALLVRTNYRGYFSNEFRKDPRDGQLKLMENNCRMPRSGMLAIAAGVNFPWLIYEDLVLNKQEDVTDYKVGTYWIDLYPDISNALWRRKEERISFRDYVRPYLSRNKVFAELDFRDRKPFWRLVSIVWTPEKLRNVLRKLLRRFHLLGQKTVLTR
jgi:predicted ATP-grasp superfamily ATP-dependent carboligase